MKIGRITASDRASAGVYEDLSGPAIERALCELFPNAEWLRRLVADEQADISQALIDLADNNSCALILTTGGTGPTARDITPEATRAVIDKELPGFGEIQRLKSFEVAPTSILTRATAGIRGSSLIVNLPGRPSAVTECLAILGPAIRKCVDLLASDSAPTTRS